MGPERGRPGRPTQAVRHTKQKAFKFKIAPHKQNSIVKKKLAGRWAHLSTMVNPALVI